MNTPVVLLDEETHVYTVDGVQKRSLSSILKPLQPEIPEAAFAMVENARFRGRQIHEACAMILKGEQYDPAELADESLPYVMAFMEFMAEFKPKPVQVETPLYCERLDFCCTPDFTTPSAVWDIKTTAKPSRTWGLQTAAQALSCHAWDRYVIWLRPKVKRKYEICAVVADYKVQYDARIYSPRDFQVIEDACRGDYDSPAVIAWKAGA